jgi:signal transduction histidine kinase
MEGLVKSLNGKFSINSKPGNGTGIYIVIPKNRNKENMEEGAAL